MMNIEPTDDYQCWKNDAGQYHRVDGPARIWSADGRQEWYINDKPHRIDGPAVIWADNTQEWYKNGRRHRTDGPAYQQEWYLNGKVIEKVDLEEWMKQYDVPIDHTLWDDCHKVLFLLMF